MPDEDPELAPATPLIEPVVEPEQEPDPEPVDVVPDELPEFDPRYREEFQGLLYLGKLTDSFNLLGHQFVIRTLHDDDLLQVALIHKQYRDTVGATRAYVCAVVAACVETADGKGLPQPLGESGDEPALMHAFNFVTQSWYSVVSDRIYERYLALEEKVRQVIDAMGKAPGSGPSTPS